MPSITCTVCEWHFRGAKYRINTTLQYKNLCHQIYFLVFKYKFHSSVQPHVYYYIPTMLWFWLLYIDSRSRTDEDILWLMSSVNCCNMKCLRKLSIEDINYCESSFKNVEQTTRRNLILGYLHTHSKPIHSGGFETALTSKRDNLTFHANVWNLVLLFSVLVAYCPNVHALNAVSPSQIQHRFV